LVAVYTRLMD